MVSTAQDDCFLRDFTNMRKTIIIDTYLSALALKFTTQKCYLSWGNPFTSSGPI